MKLPALTASQLRLVQFPWNEKISIGREFMGAGKLNGL